jgi:hypothetical protein
MRNQQRGAAAVMLFSIGGALAQFNQHPLMDACPDYRAYAGYPQ